MGGSLRAASRDVLVTVGGAGPEGVLLRTREEIDRKLHAGMTPIHVIDAIDDVLKKVVVKIWSDQTNLTCVLVAIGIAGEFSLHTNLVSRSMIPLLNHRVSPRGWGFTSDRISRRHC